MFVGSPPFPRAHSFASTFFASLFRSWLFALRMICELGAIPRKSECVEATAPATLLACAIPGPDVMKFFPFGQFVLTSEQKKMTGCVALLRDGFVLLTPSSSWMTGRDEVEKPRLPSAQIVFARSVVAESSWKRPF